MNNSSDTAVVILAAGSVKDKYKSYSFLFDSPALVPIASRSTVSFILDFYACRDIATYLVINRNDEALIKNELRYYDKVQLLTIANTRGVCDTLQQALVRISEEDIIVNLVTTIPTEYVDKQTVQIDTQLSTYDNYSGVIKGEKSYFFKFKSDIEKQEKQFHAFTGIFRAGRSSILEAISELRQYTDLLEITKLLAQTGEIFFKETEWIDTGHEINYAEARKKLISGRTFNSIRINENSGLLYKKSKNVKKLINEIEYVGMLPSEIQVFYPRVFSHNRLVGEAVIEYYGYSNLSEYQLYRSIDPMHWFRIFASLRYVLRVMESHKFSIGRKAFERFYLVKTIDRVQEYSASLSNSDPLIKNNSLCINDLKCDNFAPLKRKIKEKIDGLYDENDFCIMHGDLCFNNILYCTFSDTIKFIDPRGSFGDQCIGIYGDQKYDLAKLLHSSVGNYDYIVNNLFQYVQDGDAISYTFPIRKNHELLEQLSIDLLTQANQSWNNIMFIMGLLFLSMCPLHADNSLRQRLMYAHGLYIINQYI